MAPIRMERVEAGVRTVIAFTDAFNRRDLAAMLKLFSDDCLFDASSPAPGGAAYKGKDAITQYWHDFFLQFPQAHLKLEETLGYGLRCISRWTMERTNSSNLTSRLRGADIFRFQNGLITEHLSYVKA